MPAVQREPEQQVFSVVILGNFNPKIFHPLWYAQNELIAKQEIDEADDVLCSSEVSSSILTGFTSKSNSIVSD
jgi:hypothetical protein